MDNENAKENGFPGFAFQVNFYFGPYLRAFWEIFFIFSRLLKQIQVLPMVFVGSS